MALFKKDKSEKKKGENIIGKIIYSCLLFAPMFAVAVACMYVIFNKNAYQSYSDTSLQDATLVTSSDTQIVGQTYLLNFIEKETVNTTSLKVEFTNTTIDFTQFSGVNYEVTGYRIRYDGTAIYLFDSNDTQHNVQTNANQIKAVMNGQTIVYKNGNLYSNLDTYKIEYYLITYKQSSLDNVFYYQLEKLEESDLFNWSKNTGTYTVLKTTSVGLGITNDYTPMLLAYWLIISVMYFLYDIALILIWAVHDKIHELKDSI